MDNLELDAEPGPIAAVLKDAALHLDMPGVGRLNGSVLLGRPLDSSGIRLSSARCSGVASVLDDEHTIDV